MGKQSGLEVAQAAAAAAGAVASRLAEGGDRVSALIAAAVELNGLLGFENTLRITLPVTGTSVRVRTVCEILPDIEVEDELEVIVGRGEVKHG